MKLSFRDLENRKSWERIGYGLPTFNVNTLGAETRKNPLWLHFGAGNIFRIFPAMMQQKLLNGGLSDRGIVICETYDEELIPRAFRAFDNLSLAVTLKADGSMEKTVVASITESLTASQDKARLEEVFTSDSLQMASFTITEKGYAVWASQGKYLGYIQKDVDEGPEKAASLLGLLTALCYKRYKKGSLPLSLVSMDNCSHNGDKLKEAVLSIATEWEKKGFVDSGFLAYINDPQKLGFPLTMIDKITPRPAEGVREKLEADGLEGMDIFVTSKGVYAAGFVNAEETGYLVIEDWFPNGKLPLDKAGTIYTDRATVDKVEKMKVCTCLNPLHTVLGVFGCMLGLESIADTVNDKDLRELVNRIGYGEGMPVVVDPGIISPRAFLDEVLNLRFPNPFVPDTPQRIVEDTSHKIPVRFGETLKAYVAKGEDISKLEYIPLFFAGYLRYLTAVGDDGEKFSLSPDPLLDELTGYMEGISPGSYAGYNEKARPILENDGIFGVDLYQYGLADKVLGYLDEMLAEKGAVRATLQKYLK